jgi:hypothetical protein
MFRIQAKSVTEGERAVSRLRYVLLAGMLMGTIGASAPALANDETRDGAAAPQRVQPPSKDATSKPGSGQPRTPQVAPPMTPGCPYRGAKLELIV